jgi:DNA-binding response OmpR family regulator
LTSRVLVVEDDDDLASLLTHRLRKAEFSVERAANGAAGVDLTRSFQPEVILMDWMMPIKSGIEACEEIRADYLINQPYIIFLSAKNGPDDIARARFAGVDEYITKPFQPIALIDHVQAIIQLRAAG